MRLDDQVVVEPEADRSVGQAGKDDVRELEDDAELFGEELFVVVFHVAEDLIGEDVAALGEEVEVLGEQVLVLLVLEDLLEEVVEERRELDEKVEEDNGIVLEEEKVDDLGKAGNCSGEPFKESFDILHRDNRNQQIETVQHLLRNEIVELRLPFLLLNHLAQLIQQRLERVFIRPHKNLLSDARVNIVIIAEVIRPNFLVRTDFDHLKPKVLLPLGLRNIPLFLGLLHPQFL